MGHEKHLTACPDEGSCLQKVMRTRVLLGTSRLANSGCYASQHSTGRGARSLSAFDPPTF